MPRWGTTSLALCFVFLFAGVGNSEPRDLDTREGAFAGAENVSPEKNADQFAALEQQRWREFRYDILEDIRITAALTFTSGELSDVLPDADQAAMISLHVSQDGEKYSRVANGALISKDSFLSILIAQTLLQDDDARVSFVASNWVLTLKGETTLPDAVEILRETVGDDGALGCQQIGCGEAAASGPGQSVSGSTNLTPSSTLPDAPVQRLTADPTAKELQVELARVGCYIGAIDGLWGPASRKAMAAFNAANNSDAPVETATPKALVSVARAGEPVCGDQ